MGNGFAGRQVDVAAADLALEQGGEAVYRPTGFFQEVKQLDQVALVALNDLAEAHVQSVERRFVSGQYQ